MNKTLYSVFSEATSRSTKIDRLPNFQKMAKLEFVKIGTSLLLSEMSTLHPLNSAFESPRSDDPISVSGSSRDAIRVHKPVSKKIEIRLEFP